MKDRPVRALVDEAVGRHGDDQDVAELAGLLEMADVADVQRVEDAVAVDDLLVVGRSPAMMSASSCKSLTLPRTFWDGSHAIMY